MGVAAEWDDGDAAVVGAAARLAASLSMPDGASPSPRELLDRAAGHGLAGLLVPRALGGGGGSHRLFGAVVEAVARADASAAVVLDVHMSVATEPIVRFGSDEQRRRYLPRLASGEWLGAFALSEPGSGSDAASLTTRAEPVAGGWLLSGTKAWITNAGAADLYTVLARTAGPGARGISAFLVEARWPGVRAERPLRKLGLRGSWTAGLVLDGVEVPAANRLHDEGAGFAVAMAALDSGRIGISAQAAGIAAGALDAVLAEPGVGDVAADDLGAAGEAAVVDESAAGRSPAGVAQLGELAARVGTARAIWRAAADACDRGEPVTRIAAIAKLVATDVAVEVAHAAVERCAPRSADDLHPASVRLRDAKACQIYEGTNQIQRVVIARELLRAGAAVVL